MIWGLFHGFFLVLERTRFGAWVGKLPKALRHVYTLLIVVVGWALFRADTLTQAISFLRAMFGCNGATLTSQMLESTQALQLLLGDREGAGGASGQLVTLVLTKQVIWLGLAGVVFSTPLGSWLHTELSRISSRTLRPLVDLTVVVGEPLLLTALFVFSAASVADGIYNPFIYFRF